jgi:para-aminobenzoate synthetase/4-amino-4-deoxychorismate lyase
VFETLLVVEGEPIELHPHLQRLAGSIEALFDTSLPERLESQVVAAARALRLGRMRITAIPGAGEPRTVLATEDVTPADFFPGWERGARLRSRLYPGGLGRHKWADRRPLEGSTAATVPLLVDQGEEVLEAGRANIFAVVDQALVTPADDGRILPGIARAGAIAAAREAGLEVTERRLGRDQLLGAEAVFLTGSVRGVEPVRWLDGVQLPASSELSRRVAAGLRRRWLGAPLAAAAPAPAGAPPPGPLAR